MINHTEKIISTLKKNSGLSITELVVESGLSRTQVRTAIAFLLGAKKINERLIGMAKLYTVKR